MLKRCSNCFEQKPTSDFYAKRWKVGPKELPIIRAGFQSRCKACNTEVCRGYNERRRDRGNVPLLLRGAL